MTGRQIVNRNSYVVVAGLALLVAAYFVAISGSLASWLVWIVAVVALYFGWRALKPGKGTAMSETQLERLVGAGQPVLLELYSNY
ncbi:MAG: hypothetical protein JOZ39_07130 [Chloroflexi bacterium]|nr:hypothetical protein [Chloroflexota bacterium]